MTAVAAGTTSAAGRHRRRASSTTRPPAPPPTAATPLCSRGNPSSPFTSSSSTLIVSSTNRYQVHNDDTGTGTKSCLSFRIWTPKRGGNNKNSKRRHYHHAQPAVVLQGNRLGPEWELFENINFQTAATTSDHPAGRGTASSWEDRQFRHAVHSSQKTTATINRAAAALVSPSPPSSSPAAAASARQKNKKSVLNILQPPRQTDRSHPTRRTRRVQQKDGVYDGGLESVGKRSIQAAIARTTRKSDRQAAPTATASMMPHCDLDNYETRCPSTLHLIPPAHDREKPSGVYDGRPESLGKRGIQAAIATTARKSGRQAAPTATTSMMPRWDLHNYESRCPATLHLIPPSHDLEMASLRHGGSSVGGSTITTTTENKTGNKKNHLLLFDATTAPEQLQHNRNVTALADLSDNDDSSSLSTSDADLDEMREQSKNEITPSSQEHKVSTLSTAAIHVDAAALQQQQTTPRQDDNGADYYVNLINGRAMQAVRRGDHRSALRDFQTVLHWLHARHGLPSAAVASAYHNLGTVYAKMQAAAATAGGSANHNDQVQARRMALKCFQAAARTARDALGPQHPDVAVSLVRIGFLFLQSSLYQHAVITFQEALRIRLASFGARHGLVANLYNNLGVCYMHLAEFAVGRQYLDQALLIQREILLDISGEDDDEDKQLWIHQLEMANTLFNIGGLCLEHMRRRGPDVALARDAEASSAAALKIRVAVLGPNDPSVLHVQTLLELAQQVSRESVSSLSRPPPPPPAPPTRRRYESSRASADPPTMQDEHPEDEDIIFRNHTPTSPSPRSKNDVSRQQLPVSAVSVSAGEHDYDNNMEGGEQQPGTKIYIACGQVAFLLKENRSGHE